MLRRSLSLDKLLQGRIPNEEVLENLRTSGGYRSPPPLRSGPRGKHSPCRIICSSCYGTTLSQQKIRSASSPRSALKKLLPSQVGKFDVKFLSIFRPTIRKISVAESPTCRTFRLRALTSSSHKRVRTRPAVHDAARRSHASEAGRHHHACCAVQLFFPRRSEIIGV